MEITINKIGSFLSRHNPYDIFIDGDKHSSFLKGDTFTINVPTKRCVLKLREFANQFAFHTIQKEVVVFPSSEDCKVICEVEAKTNWLGTLTYGLLGPFRNIHVTVSYI